MRKHTSTLESSSQTVTHGFNSDRVMVTVYSAKFPHDIVPVYIEKVDTNNVRIEGKYLEAEGDSNKWVEFDITGATVVVLAP